MVFQFRITTVKSDISICVLVNNGLNMHGSVWRIYREAAVTRMQVAPKAVSRGETEYRDRVRGPDRVWY